MRLSRFIVTKALFRGEKEDSLSSLRNPIVSCIGKDNLIFIAKPFDSLNNKLYSDAICRVKKALNVFQQESIRRYFGR